MGNDKVLDQTYYDMSKLAYHDSAEIPDEVKIRDEQKNVLQTWHVSNEIDNSLLHDKKTGFDAVVFERDVDGKKQVVVAFRGTQGDDLFGEGAPDLTTDIDYVALGKPVHEKANLDTPTASMTGGEHIYYNKENEQYEYRNQFTNTDELLKEVKKKYRNAEISTTGHSLGGANAEYGAALHDLNCVSYNAPSVTHLLPEDVKKLAEEGYFKNTIHSYVHPDDSIGAGPMSAYKSHVGSTYYIAPPGEHNKNNLMSQLNSKSINENIIRFYNSVAGKGFHYLPYFKFDKDGNLANSFMMNWDTKEQISSSPRANAVMSHPNSGQIRINWEYVEISARNIKRYAEEFQSEVPKLTSDILSLLETTESKRLERTIMSIRSDLESTSHWYVSNAKEIGDFIEKKAKEYRTTDESYK